MLTGRLPSVVLPFLLQLLLDDNRFTEVPPDFFRGLRSLLEWELPRDLRRLSSLRWFSASNARLTGAPTHLLGDGSAYPDLTSVLLSNNQLSGMVPASFASRWLITLDLSNNRLSGPIGFIANLPTIMTLLIDGNSFSGPLPDFTALDGLVVFTAAHNLLTGVVPPSLVRLNLLSSVSLTDNFLQGSLPVFASNVNTDMAIAAFNNNFCRPDHGSCDPRVDNLITIAAAFGFPEVLAASWRGNDPYDGWIGVYCDGGGGGKITRLDLSRLGLSGFIDPAFGSLTWLVANNLTGEIPVSITWLPSLRLLDVADNALEGTLEFRADVDVWADGNPNLHVRSCSPLGTPEEMSFRNLAGTIVMVLIVMALS
uniref:Leucine-rich repeat-containing N-terminal plant-type domain-containing protein n=1 Tax=Oryza meridionalis TaxID=40149 RepID=A0A0E0EYA4_9ORYZ